MKRLECYGCGSEMQTYDDSKAGYQLLVKKEHQYCLRCFRIKHYNDLLTVKTLDYDCHELFKVIKYNEGVVFYVVSIVDFYGSLLTNFHKNLEGLKVYLIINKIDTVIPYLPQTKIKKWVKDQVKKIAFKFVDIILISVKSEDNWPLFLNLIEQQTNDIYWIGKTNVGKTSLINKVLTSQKEVSRKLPIISHFPNTTMNLIKIEYKNYLNLYDTPGLFDESQLDYYVNKEAYKLLGQGFKLDKQSYQLETKQTLTVIGLLQLTVKEGPISSFHFYCANKLMLHRSKEINKQRIWQQQLVFLKPDVKMKEHHIKITKKKEEQVAIHIFGYGWITFKARQQQLSLLLPEKCQYQIIKPLV